MQKKEKIIILHYGRGEVFVFDYDSIKYGDFEDFYKDINEEEDLDFTVDNTHCMIVEDELSINFL